MSITSYLNTIDLISKTVHILDGSASAILTYRRSRVESLTLSEKVNGVIQATFVILQVSDVIGNDLNRIPLRMLKVSVVLKTSTAVADLSRFVAIKIIRGSWSRSDARDLTLNFFRRAVEISQLVLNKAPSIIYRREIEAGNNIIQTACVVITNRKTIRSAAEIVSGVAQDILARGVEEVFTEVIEKITEIAIVPIANLIPEKVCYILAMPNLIVRDIVYEPMFRLMTWFRT